MCTVTINQGRYLRAFLASRTTHRHAITLERTSCALPYCVVFPAMINSHVRFIVVAFIPCARTNGKKKREKEILSQYISHDYSRVYSMEIGITYLYPYDDDGNSNDSIFLPRRQGARGYTHRTTFAYDESKTITIQSLCSASFACHRLPCRALHTATAVG